MTLFEDYKAASLELSNINSKFREIIIESHRFIAYQYPEKYKNKTLFTIKNLNNKAWSNHLIVTEEPNDEVYIELADDDGLGTDLLLTMTIPTELVDLYFTDRGKYNKELLDIFSGDIQRYKIMEENERKEKERNMEIFKEHDKKEIEKLISDYKLTYGENP